jgi:hypothetical protein
MNNKILLAKINDICSRMERARNSDMLAGGGIGPWFKRLDGIFDEARKLSDSSPRGLRVGKLVSWSVGDGHANYFVTKVGKDICQLQHLDYIDNWHSPTVVNGKAMTEAVARAIGLRECLNTIFESK